MWKYLLAILASTGLLLALINLNGVLTTPKQETTAFAGLNERLQQTFGEHVTLSALGYATQEDDGLHINLKEADEALMAFFTAEGAVVEATAQLSADELTAIADDVQRDIASYYNFAMPSALRRSTTILKAHCCESTTRFFYYTNRSVKSTKCAPIGVSPFTNCANILAPIIL